MNTKIISNESLYTNELFDAWAYREGLTQSETYLIETFLNPTKRTVEAGTAGGKILFGMKDLGFQDLHGFDYIPGFIEQAQKRNIDNFIDFQVQDATALQYQNDSFDQILYLQQIVSSIESAVGRNKSIEEAYRILKPGGKALFSFLSFESRLNSSLYSAYLNYLKVFRAISGNKSSSQYLPWLKLGNKFNFSSLLDRKPYVYWYKISEAHELLCSKGFTVKLMGSDIQISQGELVESLNKMLEFPLKGMIYFVAEKN
jgi:SAM-dependent methyltransferase